MRISDAQMLLFITVIDFDFPAVNIGLNEFADIDVVGVAQQIGGIAVIDLAVGREMIRNRGQYDQAKVLFSRPSLPQDIVNFFVTDLSIFSADEELS